MIDPCSYSIYHDSYSRTTCTLDIPTSTCLDGTQRRRNTGRNNITLTTCSRQPRFFTRTTTTVATETSHTTLGRMRLTELCQLRLRLCLNLRSCLGVRVGCWQGHHRWRIVLSDASVGWDLMGRQGLEGTEWKESVWSVSIAFCGTT